MAKRLLFYRFFLWWAVIGMSIWTGGTIFSMSVIVPMWSCTLPGSARFSFSQTSFNLYLEFFWAAVYGPA